MMTNSSSKQSSSSGSSSSNSSIATHRAAAAAAAAAAVAAAALCIKLTSRLLRRHSFYTGTKKRVKMAHKNKGEKNMRDSNHGRLRT